MSATLPKLDKMIDEDRGNFISLIKDTTRYYQNPLFKNRVEIDFSLLEFKKIDLEILADKVINFKEKKVLVEFISKGTARKFYNILNNMNEMNEYMNEASIVELTGDDNIKTRKALIKDIKKTKSIIVVATQVIEAGIDIDMDIGFKDISIPDADEQFLGRINRSCQKKESKVYFFKHDDTAMIYKGDLRLNYPITDKGVSQLFVNKDFEGIYSKVLDDLKNKTDELNRNNIKNIIRDCLELKFNNVEKAMRLIEPNIQLFIAYEIKDDKDDLNNINGREIWQEFKLLSQDKSMDYAKKKVVISRLKEKMSYFTYSVYNNDNLVLRCDEEFAGYYYIEDGERYIIDSKFDRQGFSLAMKGRFL